MQKPRTGPNTGACRNIPWVSAAANVATAASGDAATLANIVASGSAENAGCNAAQGPSNYTVSSPKGTFIETAGSGSLQFTDASNNSIFNLSPQVSLTPNQSITLLYQATFDNSVLLLPAGSQVRAEAMVTFGNSGLRGGSGSSATNIDVDGDGCIDNSTNTCPVFGTYTPVEDNDEANVRTVPCRVTKTIPDLIAGNSTVTLSDESSDVSVTGTNVSVGNFSGFGTSSISATTTLNLSVDETCTPPGAATITNTAHLDGSDVTVNVQTGVTCTDPLDPTTCTPVYTTFTCVEGVELDDPATASVTCEAPPTGFDPGDYCSFTQGGWGARPAGNNPGTILANNFATVYPGGFVEVGIPGTGGFSLKLTSDEAVCKYLPAGGTAGALTADLTANATTCAANDQNDPSTSSGVFGGQVLALELNVDFNNAGFHLGTDGPISGLQLCNTGTSLDGQTVAQILAVANTALGGGALPSGYTIATLNDLVSNLNEAFDNCGAPTAFAQANLCVAP